MLTKEEEAGVKKVLALLADDELQSLARTITKNQIDVSSIEDAVRAVLSFTSTPAELLRRRKVKRDVLFRYLYNEGVAVAPSADKYLIIQRILQHWGSDDVPLSYLMNEEQVGSHSGPTLTTAGGNNSWRDVTLQTSAEDEEMALQFSHWFYPMWNACNPSYPTLATAAEPFTPLHFFADVQLHLLSLVGDEPHTETFSGAGLVCERLSALVRDERLIFSPNLEPAGRRGCSDPHGRRVVIVCGTVHRASDVIGLFEQQFALVRDPLADNNWKIKMTRLALTSSSARSNRLPTLSETRAMLTAP